MLSNDLAKGTCIYIYIWQKEGDRKDTLYDKGRRRFMLTNVIAMRKIRCTLKMSHAGDSDRGKVQHVMIHFLRSCDGIFAVHLSAHHKTLCVQMVSIVYLSVSELKTYHNLS